MKYLLLIFVSASFLFNFQLSSENMELTGKIVRQGEPDYEKGRLVSNYYNAKNKFPKVIVYAQNTKDVQNAVKWAVDSKTPIRIRSGGHQHEGQSTGNNAIIIDV